MEKKRKFLAGLTGSTDRCLWLFREGDEIRLIPLTGGQRFYVAPGNGEEKNQWSLMRGDGHSAHGDGKPLYSFDNQKDAERALVKTKWAIDGERQNDKKIFWFFCVGIMLMLFVTLSFFAIFDRTTLVERQASLRSEPQNFQVAQGQSAPTPPSTMPAPLPPPSARIDPALLPVADQAWSSGKADGPPLYVFSDPTCPYCRNLEAALEDLRNDFRVYLFPTPRLGGDALAIAARIACSGKDPMAAWRQWMIGGVLPGPSADQKQTEQCIQVAASALAENVYLSRALGFPGVPALIREDGSVWSGDGDAVTIRAWIAAPAAPARSGTETCGNDNAFTSSPGTGSGGITK